MKIIYIRLDSSPLPTASPNLIVKDVNTDNYFCSFLGKQIINKANKFNLSVFPGELITDYASVDKSAYDMLIQKYREILLTLLSNTSKIEIDFSFQLPYKFIDWLCYHENDDYREVGNQVSSTQISFTSRDLYDAIVDKVLLPQLKFFFKKMNEPIEFIAFSLPLPQQNLLSKSLLIENIRVADLREFKLKTEYELCNSRNGLIRIMNKETRKYGFINENGEEVIPCIYEFATDFNIETAFAYDGKECYKIYLNGDRESIWIITANNRWFDCSKYFSDGLLRIRTDEYQYSFFDIGGNKVFSVECKRREGQVGYFHEGLACLHNGDYIYGYIDKTGKEIIPCQFNEARDFHEGLAAVRIGDRWGYINKKGKLVIPCKYHRAENFCNGKALVKIYENGEEKGRLINKEGKIEDVGLYNILQSLSEGMLLVSPRKNYYDRLDIYDENYNYMFSHELGYFGKYSDGVLLIEHDIPNNSLKNIVYMDKKGNKIASVKEEFRGRDECSFSNGLALIAKEEYPFHNIYGYIDKNGTEAIPCEYEEAHKFSEGLALVTKMRCGDYGFINTQGETVIPGIFRSAGIFNEGVAVVGSVDGKYGIILKEWFVR